MISNDAPFYLRTSLPKEKLPKKPSIRPEKNWAKNHACLCVGGVDEAGRGPLAGPVVAAVVVFDLTKKRPVGLNDSKKLSEEQRVELFQQIKNSAMAYGVSYAEPEEIDRINILQATKLAVRRSLYVCNERLISSGQPTVDGLVTDALFFEDLPIPQHSLVKGDLRSVSVAAASILAKVTRDRLMVLLDREFPQYGFARHKGYPTKSHYESIQKHGASSVHRFTFRGVRDKESHKQLVNSLTYQDFLSKADIANNEDFDLNNIENIDLTSIIDRIPDRERTEFFSRGFDKRYEIVKKNTNFSLELDTLQD